MTNRILCALRRTRVDERAYALPMALGMMLVLAISLVAVLTFSSSSERHSELSKAEQTAVAVAEAGLNHAESVLASNAASASALPPAGSPEQIPVEGGTVQYWGSRDANLIWTITARSSVSNPTGGSAISHTVTAQVQVAPSTVPENDAWNYVFSDAPGCTYYQNTVQVGAPIYTKGDLCMKNTAAVLGPRVDVYGGIQLEDTGRVGTSPSDASDPAVRTRLGCRFGSSPSWPAIPPGAPLGCPDSTLPVYRSSFSNAPPELDKPPYDATKRNIAKPGPFQYCTTGSFPGGPGAFTSTGVINLMPSSSYTCQVWSSPPSGGTLLGELSWNNTTKVLTVFGTAIWFDGELVMSGSQQGTYDGKATIYFAKKINLANQTELCALSGCPTSGWDPNTELLALVTGAPDFPAFDLQNDAKFQGAAYAVGGFRLQNNAVMHGPVIASALDIQNNGLPASWPQLNSVLNGMPQNSTSNWTTTAVPGSWRG
jgi:Tfp pilus assembly protein PilX